MATKTVNCPHCGKKLEPYQYDQPRPQRTSGTCSCGGRYTVESGQGKIKIKKG